MKLLKILLVLFLLSWIWFTIKNSFEAYIEQNSPTQKIYQELLKINNEDKNNTWSIMPYPQLSIESIINDDVNKAQEFIFSLSDELNNISERKKEDYDDIAKGFSASILLKTDGVNAIKSFWENKEKKYNERDKELFSYDLNNVKILELNVLWKEIEWRERGIVDKRFFVFNSNLDIIGSLWSDNVFSVNLLDNNLLIYLNEGKDNEFLEFIDTKSWKVYKHKYISKFTDITSIWSHYLYLEDKTLPTFSAYQKDNEESNAYLLNLVSDKWMEKVIRKMNNHLFIWNNYFVALKDWNLEVYKDNKLFNLPLNNRLVDNTNTEYIENRFVKPQDDITYFVLSSPHEDIYLYMGEKEPTIIFLYKRTNQIIWLSKIVKE